MPERSTLQFSNLVLEKQEGDSWSLEIGCADSVGCGATQVTGINPFLFERQTREDRLTGQFARRDLQVLRDILTELADKVNARLAAEPAAPVEDEPAPPDGDS